LSGYGEPGGDVGRGSAAGPGTPDAGPASERVRIRRKPARGHYDAQTIHEIIDQAIVGYVGWVRDGQPYVTPVNVWRHGDRLLWHASVGSGMGLAIEGRPVCVTVSHLDSLVLARAATNHSVNYRSVMALGVAQRISDDTELEAALEGLIESLFPGRWAQLRPMTDAERRATAVFWIDLDEASAKVRDEGLTTDTGDEDWPVWGGAIPVRTVRGELQPDEHVTPDLPLPEVRLP
jgi:nitroimidazol reductase NimA-like FMN-containing flavoprotein (pyridoxamine 5'-phosphate oxidase superfamily)